MNASTSSIPPSILTQDTTTKMEPIPEESTIVAETTTTTTTTVVTDESSNSTGFFYCKRITLEEYEKQAQEFTKRELEALEKYALGNAGEPEVSKSRYWRRKLRGDNSTQRIAGALLFWFPFFLIACHLLAITAGIEQAPVATAAAAATTDNTTTTTTTTAPEPQNFATFYTNFFCSRNFYRYLGVLSIVGFALDAFAFTANMRAMVISIAGAAAVYVAPCLSEQQQLILQFAVPIAVGIAGAAASFVPSGANKSAKRNIGYALPFTIGAVTAGIFHRYMTNSETFFQYSPEFVGSSISAAALAAIIVGPGLAAAILAGAAACNFVKCTQILKMGPLAVQGCAANVVEGARQLVVSICNSATDHSIDAILKLVLATKTAVLVAVPIESLLQRLLSSMNSKVVAPAMVATLALVANAVIYFTLIA